MKLGEICEKNIDTIKDSYNDFIDYIDISSVNNKSKEIIQTQTIMAQEAPSRAKQIVKVGDILVSTVRPNLNAVAIVEKSSDNLLVASTGYCVLRCLPNTYNRYIFYFCQSPLFIRAMTSQATGASYPAVTSTIIKNCSLNIPTIDEQRRIAAVLGKVTDLIAQRRAQLDKLDLLVKSRFVEMFGDPVSNPKSWPEENLQKNIQLLNGRAYKQEELLDSGKYPVLRVGNFFSNRNWYYSNLELEPDKYCDNGDLLYAWSASFGPQIWQGGKVIYHYHIWKVVIKDAYNKQFLCKLLEYVTASLMSETHGIAMMHLTKSGMEQTPFIVPPMELQEQFSLFVENIECIKSNIQYSLDKMVSLKKSLLFQYFKEPQKEI